MCLEEIQAEMDGNVAAALVKKLIMNHVKGEEPFASLQLTLTTDIRSEDIMGAGSTTSWVSTDAYSATKAAKQQIT